MFVCFMLFLQTHELSTLSVVSQQSTEVNILYYSIKYRKSDYIKPFSLASQITVIIIKVLEHGYKYPVMFFDIKLKETSWTGMKSLRDENGLLKVIQLWMW